MKHLYVRKFSQSESFQRALFIYFLSFSFILKAQNYPPSVLLSDIQYESYQNPSGPLPGYLETNTNEFGNSFKRISDASEFGTTGQNLRHHYSKDQPWNSDGSLIKLNGYPAAILDADSYEFLYWSSIPSEAMWSNINPNLMYGVSGNKFISFNVTTSSRETLHTFNDYSTVSLGYNEGNISADDRLVGLVGVSGGNQTLIVYNIEDDVIVATRSIGSANLDWFTVSQSGLYAVSCYAVQGSGDTQGVKVLDIDLTNRRHLDNKIEHADFGIDTNGDDVFVTFADNDLRDNDYYMKSIRLSDGNVTPMFHYTQGYGVWNGHVSCRNIARPGWAYVTEGCCSSTVGYKEMFAIKLDGSDTIERFGLHHTDESAGYGHQAHGVPNRDGSKVMFASNWNEGFTGPYPPSYVVGASATLSVEDNEAIASSDIKVYPNPSRDGIVHIKLNGNIAVKSIQVNDMLGRIILTEDMNSNDKSLNLESLPQGVYLLSFQTENSGSITKRVILN